MGVLQVARLKHPILRGAVLPGNPILPGNVRRRWTARGASRSDESEEIIAALAEAARRRLVLADGLVNGIRVVVECSLQTDARDKEVSGMRWPTLMP